MWSENITRDLIESLEITILSGQDRVVIFKLTEWLSHGLFSLLSLIFVMIMVWTADFGQRTSGN